MAFKAPKGNKFSPGRASEYTKAHDKAAYKLCLLGCTDEELADFFGIDVSTLNRWKEAHQSFCASVQAGKEQADSEVAESFFRRAKGIEYKEKTHELTAGEDGEPVMKLTKVVHKFIPPDAGAALNWLKNRQPGKWRDKSLVDVTTNGKELPAAVIYIPDNGRDRPDE